jgi:hypothetical protein
MIDRLGKLGDKAPDKGKTFNQLLVPSAASEWDIGRLGHRREVSRKLMGRLSAYSRMFQLSKLEGEDAVSFTFLDWLSETCQSAEKSRKSKSKKAKVPSNPKFVNVGSAESILQTLSEDILESTQRTAATLDRDSSDMTSFRVAGGEETLPYPKSLDDLEGISQFIEAAFEKNEVNVLESWLTENFGHPTLQTRKRKMTENGISKIAREELSYRLLNSFSAMERKVEGLGSCILAWVPKLSISAGSPKLWALLFSEGQTPRSMWSNLISRCCQNWSHSHVTQCRTWILSESNNKVLGLDNVVRFMVQSTSIRAIHVENFFYDPAMREDSAWGRSAELVVKASTLALDCLEASEDETADASLCSRNDPPDSIVLLLLIARWGRNQLQRVCQTIVERMEKAEDEKVRAILLSVILRLYAYFPHSMNLGVAVLRSLLKEAVETYPKEWLSWRSPLDDQFQDMLSAVIANGAPPRMVQALSEGSKRHPLLLLRKLVCMEQALEADAIACDQPSDGDKRGVLYGQSLTGPLPAKVDGRLVKVIVKHWGFNFTENLWVSFLDIVSTGRLSCCLFFSPFEFRDSRNSYYSAKRSIVRLWSANGSTRSSWGIPASDVRPDSATHERTAV